MSTPKVAIPPSDWTVSVSVIDSTTRLSGIPTNFFFGPTIPGFETFSVPAYAFLIRHHDVQTGRERNVIFDLGPPKDWRDDLAEPLTKRLQGWLDGGATFEIDKYVSEILVEGGTPLEEIEAIIWSHPHWDHIGRCGLFPHTTSLIVGPGVKEAFGKGYPSGANAPFLERELEGRAIKVIDFPEITIGGLRAHDFFGDGSFYLLDAPGHCVGHMNALARVKSNPDSFMYLAGDSFHHASMIRPSPLAPLPLRLGLRGGLLEQADVLQEIHPSTRVNLPDFPDYGRDLSMGTLRDTPLHTISQKPDGSSLATDLPAAKDVIARIQQFDADERVLVVAAHDSSLLEIMDFYPQLADDWMAQGWKDKGRWMFLKDLVKALEI